MTIQYNSYPDHAALVILHPNYQPQLPLLSRILGESRLAPVWVPLLNRGHDLPDAWVGFQEALMEQYGVKVPSLARSSAAAAQATVAALRPLGRFALILDSADFSNGGALNEWIAAVCAQIPEGSQILIVGRQFPHALLNEPQIGTRAALYPVDHSIMLNDYMDGKNKRPLLEVFACGQGRAFVDGREITLWEGTLPRALFFYLIERAMATRDEIFNTFWEGLSKRDATNVFHVTKRKISEMLGFDLTRYYLGFYQLEPDLNLHCDAMRFKEYVQNSAVADDHTAMVMLRKALLLHKGVYLESLNGAWVEDRREDMQATYVDALVALARLEEKQGNNEAALGLCVRAGGYQPHREDIARSVMRLFAQLGHPDRALEVYARLESELRARLNLPPDPRTVELARLIRQP